MNQLAHTFRGYWAIGDIAAMLKEAVPAYKALGKPNVSIALYPKDYDLVARWPKAGALQGFVYAEDGTFEFDGHKITRHVGRGRYENRHADNGSEP